VIVAVLLGIRAKNFSFGCGWEVEMIGPISGLPNYLGNRVRVARSQPSGPLGPFTRPLRNPFKSCSGAKNLSGPVAVSLNLGD